mmetsp:Transcript_36744/g.51246  ORF Transcript_36744/g.51246 Transcript_36744/m.51246 type:complete len:211 (+) Transcript_36744:614-1246(+)
MQMDGRSGLAMHGDDVSTCLGEVLHTLLRLHNHQMAVQHCFWMSLPESRDHSRPNGDVGHEASVHHIHMHPISTGLQHVTHFFTQLGKIRRQDGGTHLAGLFHAPQLLHSWILSSHGHHRRLGSSLRAPCTAAGTGHRRATEHRGRQTRSTHRGGTSGTGGGGGGAYLSLAAELTLLRHRCHKGTGAGGQSGWDQQRLGHFCEKNWEFLG